MPLRPSKNTGSGGSGSTTPYNPAGSGNYDFSDLIECSNSAGTYGSITLYSMLSGYLGIVSDDGYDGQILIQSSTTASSGGSIRISGATHITPKTGDSCRIWFKMPAAMDSASLVYCGFIDSGVNATPQNVCGARISGSTYNACSVVTGTQTLSASSVTLNTSARYCVEVKYTSSTTATVKLYDSSNGNVLDTSNITINSYRRNVLIVGSNSGTVAKDIVTVDALEYKLAPRGLRFPT